MTLQRRGLDGCFCKANMVYEGNVSVCVHESSQPTVGAEDSSGVGSSGTASFTSCVAGTFMGNSSLTSASGVSFFGCLERTGCG